MCRRWIRSIIGVVILSAIVLAGLGIQTLFNQEFDPVNETAEIIKLHIIDSIHNRWRTMTALPNNTLFHVPIRCSAPPNLLHDCVMVFFVETGKKSP